MSPRQYTISARLRTLQLSNLKMILVNNTASSVVLRSIGSFQSLVGMLTRATRGVRNQAQEMINNLRIIQHPLRHSVDPTMNTELAYFVQSRLTDRRRSKFSKQVQTHHKVRTEDASVRRLFPHALINYYQTLNLGRVRLCTRSYSHEKIADDSNIVFRLNGNEKFGRIRAIVTVDGRQPLMFVAHLSNVLPLVCRIDTSETFSYPGIQTGLDLHWSFVLINIDDFVEKCVYFERSNSCCTFFRFPNLTHCS